MPPASNSSWPVAATFTDFASAHVLAERLKGESVPAEVIGGTSLFGEIQRFDVYVPPELAHRARWVISQAQFTDEELTYLAVGKLEGTADSDT
jgi:hypothetical protein